MQPRPFWLGVKEVITEKIFYDTTPVDMEKASEAIYVMYKHYNLPRPRIQLASGLDELAVLAQQVKSEPIDLEKHSEITVFWTCRHVTTTQKIEYAISRKLNEYEWYNKNKGFFSNVFFPPGWAYGNKQQDWEWIKHALSIWKNTYLCVCYKDTVIILDRPKEVYCNENGFHNRNGAAVRFGDGSEIYAYEGIGVEDRYILETDRLTLFDIHKGNTKKRILISLVGVERYLDMVRNFKIETKNRFQKFFSFPQIEENPRIYDGYSLRIKNAKINDEYGLALIQYSGVGKNDGSHWERCYHLPGNPLQHKCINSILDKKDYDLWRVLNFQETLRRGVFYGMILSYNDHKFNLKMPRLYDNYSALSCDACPSWVKARMFLKEDFTYKTDVVKMVVEKGKIVELKTNDKLKWQDSLWGDIPSYKFDLNLQSETWEGLLKQWADFAFKWIGMHETCMYLS
ncbi:MAG: hypothetical protein DWQ19_12240 [Crenarchaeota archaeon]|nr:MAG: hypothetical protein DWQ19_12240 [Thermoproteota archaeon]